MTVSRIQTCLLYTSNHTIETQVKNLVEDTVKTQVENVEQAFNSLNISCSGYTEDEMLSLTFWPKLYVQLDELDLSLIHI